MDSLPGEIMVNILSRLPIKPLLRCKSVCKSFLNITLDPYLIEAHLDRASSHDQNPSLILNTTVLNGTTHFRSQLYYTTLTPTQSNSPCDEVPFSPLNFGEFRVEGSCRGLLFLRHRTIDDFMFVINPCTGKRFEIPKLIIASCGVERGIAFGFSPKGNEYKVVKVIDGSASYVFSLSEGVWREAVGGAPSFKISENFESDECVCVNGVIHWSCYSPLNFIVCFDVGNEVFGMIPYPAGKLQLGEVTLVLFSGCIGFIEYDLNSEDDRVNIWVMEDYNVRESWTRSVIINVNHIGWDWGRFEILCVRKNGEVLMLHRNQALLVYDPKTMSCRKPNIVGLPSWFEAVCHVGSLVSPLGY
ncbi:F-box protein At3g07870 [Rhododendron vialii]|uniref:F-box protein At3g07870 n=1 Tax=Rhododendron vialii TaxID=182163 RepID=UPI00265FC59D|nr:F-box protein At3g07870 [Rhododendron vialii]